MRNYIILNGKNSNEINGLLIQELPPISKPQIRTEIEEIDGRDGDIVTKLGFAAYDKEISVGLYKDFDINEIIAYFNSEGTIVFSNEPDKYYNYQIIDQIDFERLVRYRTATIRMHCQPFKYSNTQGTITKDASDTVSDEGSNLVLENTAEAPFKRLDPKGNFTQQTYSGKNIFNKSDLVASGSTLTMTDNGWRQVTTSSGYGSKIQISGLTGSTAYTLSWKFTRTSVATGAKVRIFKGTGTSQVYADSGTLSPGNGSITFTTDSGATQANIWFYNNVPGEGDTTWEFVQLEKSATATDYEPFCGLIPSPNPDFPQEIKTVSGAQTVKITGKNQQPTTWAQDFVNAVATTNASLEALDGKNCLKYTPNAGYGDYPHKNFTLGVKFKENTQYTISYDLLKTGTTNRTVAFWYTDGTNSTSSPAQAVDAWEHYTLTSTAGKTVAYIAPFYTSGDSYIDIDTFQIEEGTQGSQFEPYQSQSQEINLGKNLIDTTTIKSGDVAGGQLGARCTLYQPLYLKAGTYTFSTNLPSPFRYVIGVNSVGYPPLSSFPTFSFDSGWQSAQPYTFTLTQAGWLTIMFSKNDNSAIVPSEVLPYRYQLEAGGIATSYSPFKHTSINMLNPNWMTAGYIGSNGAITTTQNQAEMVCAEFIPVAPDTEYTFEIFATTDTYGQWMGIGQYESASESSFIERSVKTNTNDRFWTFRTKANAHFIRPSSRNLQHAVQFMLSKGGRTTYESYYAQLELAKINTYTDGFRYGDGKWYIHKELGKLNLVGSSLGITTGTLSSLRYVFGYNALQDKGWSTSSPTIGMACDTFFVDSSSEMADDRKNWWTVRGTTYSSMLWLFAPTSAFSGSTAEELLEEFRAILNAHPTTIYYPLATPTDTEITDSELIEQLEALAEAHSYKGRTHINATAAGNNAPHIIAAEVGVDNESTVTNSGNINSKPVIKIYGSGNIGAYLNDIQILQIALGDEGYITIDTNLMEAYKDTLDNLKNRLVTGDYSKFSLKPGANKIHFSGTVTKYEISKYSRWL